MKIAIFVLSKYVYINPNNPFVMNTKIEKISELSTLMNKNNAVAYDLLRLFGLFKLGSLLSRLSLEKQQGVRASDLIMALCLFRIHSESIYSAYNKKFNDLLQVGKNCFYRMLCRQKMDWRRLLYGMVLRYRAILRKEKVETDTPQAPCCYILDDTTLEKTGTHFERLSRVFDHVAGKCVCGYKLLLLAFFDGKSTLPVDFSLHAEKGKKGDYGFTAKERKAQYKKKKNTPGYIRYKEADESKLEMSIHMMKQAWQKGICARYALTDSWFTCESLISQIQQIGKGAIHFIGLAKWNRTKYRINGKAYRPEEIVASKARTQTKSCRKYKCQYIGVNAILGEQMVRLFLIRYGKSTRWRILLTTDTRLSFVEAFELYQIRWNIEVLNKENKQYMGLGGSQSRDFDAQIADATLCFITYIVLALDKRFSAYETMGAVFEERKAELFALTLWQRILPIIVRLMESLAEALGLYMDELIHIFIQDEARAEEYKVMLDALEKHKNRLAA
ncbi:MAG: transposase [Prevotellaceae bacterium]|nr:transposase [Prevotellaceae bacterium]